MILVKVRADGVDSYYLVNQITQVYQKIAKEGLSPESVETLTDNVIVDLHPERETPETFLTKCCLEFEITLADLRGPDRKKRIVSIRKVVSYQLRKKFDLSLPDIGDMLHRDHTSIIYNLESVEKQLKDGGPLINLLERIQ